MDDLLVRFVNYLSLALIIALFGRVLLSWFQVGPQSPLYPVVAIIYQVTEPILAPIRRVLPRFGMLDFSPMVALLILSAIRGFLFGFTGTQQPVINKHTV